jgi:hypothetical protein
VNFLLFVNCVLNKVVDQEACDFIRRRWTIKLSPMTISYSVCHSRRAEGLPASWRENVKRRREERMEEKEVPPARRGMVGGMRAKSLRSR